MSNPLRLLCSVGLGLTPSDLPPHEFRRQAGVVEELVRDYGKDQVVLAIRYGMPFVWPFSEDRPFDATDLRQNMLKALGEARRRQKAGQIPFNPQEAP